MEHVSIQGEASAIEIANAGKVVAHLSSLNQYGYKNLRDDIFVVTDIESGQECIVDVEESIVCIYMEVCDAPTTDEQKLALFELLLTMNSRAIHGRFEVFNDKVVFKDNLEIANLDQNELEASLRWMFGVIEGGIEQIASIVQPQTEEAEAE